MKYIPEFSISYRRRSLPIASVSGLKPTEMAFKSWLVQPLKQALSFLISNTGATIYHAGLRPEGGALCVNTLNASRFAIARLCSP